MNLPRIRVVDLQNLSYAHVTLVSFTFTKHLDIDHRTMDNNPHSVYNQVGAMLLTEIAVFDVLIKSLLPRLYFFYF